MNAAWHESQGPARDVLVVGKMLDPTPAAGEVRIRLSASGINGYAAALLRLFELITGTNAKFAITPKVEAKRYTGAGERPQLVRRRA